MYTYVYVSLTKEGITSHATASILVGNVNERVWGGIHRPSVHPCYFWVLCFNEVLLVDIMFFYIYIMPKIMCIVGHHVFNEILRLIYGFQNVHHVFFLSGGVWVHVLAEMPVVLQKERSHWSGVDRAMGLKTENMNHDDFLKHECRYGIWCATTCRACCDEKKSIAQCSKLFETLVLASRYYDWCPATPQHTFFWITCFKKLAWYFTNNVGVRACQDILIVFKKKIYA